MDSQVKRRAVIYCRVSTQEQAQKDALKIQIEEARKCVRENGWLLADEYIEMESGTTRSGRTEYMRLLSDMETKMTMEKRFDIIVIKSLDRLNRCAKDWYLFVEKLIHYDKFLYIYMDRKFYKTEDSLLMGIKAILAEQYSRDLSRKVNNAHAYRQKNGTTVLLNNNTYGYRKNADKSITVEEEEAEMIQQIFLLAAQGKGAYSISNLLFDQGIRNRNGNQLGESTIRRIIRNPLYKGTAVMNRKHFDFEKKTTVNNPASAWIYHENLVPAIVEKELWESANKMLGCSSGKMRQKSVDGKRRNRLYNFSGKILCGICGAPYYKTFRKRGKHKEEVVIEWKCSTYLRHGRKKQCGCDNIFLGQKEMEEKIRQEAEIYLKNLDEKALCDRIAEVIESVLCQEEKSEEIIKNTSRKMLVRRKEKLQKKQERLLELLLENVVTESVYKKKICELKKEKKEIEGKLQKQDGTKKRESAGDKKISSRIKRIEQKLFLDGIKTIKAEYFLLQIQKITVNRTGITIDVI